MVKIVLAGGAGNVGREILDELITQTYGKHEIKVFSRKVFIMSESHVMSYDTTDVPELAALGITVDIVNYHDISALIDALKGIDTVLSFIVTINDPDNVAQKTLIDACVSAGVRRFAPSEWATKSHCGIPAYEGKDQVYEYLKEINRERKVLEFTLFQCGLFLNYFSYPRASTEFMQIFPMPIDVDGCRAIVLRDTKAQISLTSVQDLAKVVSKAVDYEGIWPEISGIRGNQISILEFISLCEKIRGKRFVIESVERADLEEGRFTSSWFPVINHPVIPDDQKSAFSQSYFATFILAMERGGWDASNEWNEFLPEFRFTGAEEFLSKIWKNQL
ncbi:hypothetical protein SBOR_6176 [Sclerotinia borealis F-4128]|uniref:NmrA-like domain-containing protein n=1 Tax=Sclerotinia borealis (strain F-4128) TaxID=1432307 RepID=W9CF91_SCLBF|nr:hypothetical protein SBOR_6176 [Sclerotinia borealis F-4128]